VDALWEYSLLEIRQRSWDRPYVDEFWHKLRMGSPDIDQPQLSASIGVTGVATSPICYPHLHGRHAVMRFAEEASRDPWYDDRDTGKALNETMDAVEVLAWWARDTYVISNNPRRGADRHDRARRPTKVYAASVRHR
jgi:uncharacterized protein YecE (DUF72 family)